MADGGPSNADADNEAAQLLEAMAQPTEQEVEPSAGTSSSASEKKPDKSGLSPQDTGSSLQSPAPDAASHSEPDQQLPQAPSSSASSTAGSTPETGSVQQSPQGSSEESVPATPPTQPPTEEVPSAGGFPDSVAVAREKFSEARDVYGVRDFDGAENLLAEALALDPSLLTEVEQARKAIRAARPNN